MEVEQLQELKHKLRAFAQARDWEQFHSPKNLAMALIVEAGELVERFQWLTEDQSAKLDGAALEAVRQELADIFLYLVRISDRLGIDLMEAATAKIEMNERRYPADKVRGSSKKYNEY